MGTLLGRSESPPIVCECGLHAHRLVLDNVRSGQNVGACFRSGDAFRIEGLDLCGITCHPPHRDILKSALGSSGHVPWRPWDNTLDAVHSFKQKDGKWLQWNRPTTARGSTSGPLEREMGLGAWQRSAWRVARSSGPLRRRVGDAPVRREAEHQRQRLRRVVLWQAALH